MNQISLNFFLLFVLKSNYLNITALYCISLIIIILHFMVIRLSVIKIVRSINDKISECYDHNFLTLLKVKETNSILLFSPFLFFNQAISTLLHCIALV